MFLVKFKWLSKLSWILPVSLLIVGIAILVLPKYQTSKIIAAGNLANSDILNKQKQDYIKATPIVDYGIPINLSIKRLGIDVSVNPGVYMPLTKTWTLNSSDAFFMKELPSIGSLEGPLVIYGHANKQVFLPLNGLADSETLKINTSTGYTVVYRYVGSAYVDPNNFDSVKTTDANLLVMTCSGPTFSKRQIARFMQDGIKLSGQESTDNKESLL